ncbi:NCS2 family permease [Bacillus carboniphilus]|uniref:NCS2 family permease n=1 Tax=Bacillus carboniphilus TaxID=86663 RepID=A0ABY9JXE6_9BACI|nr:NCS2 family permease [Bacillus carboniphilus]WLR43183.1 NCS2 family permease [Bacillus carboniphilus]
MERFFQLNKQGTTIRKELLAGTISFFTIVYIVVVNASILTDAGIPLEAGILATVLSSFVGCLIMGFFGNTPIIVVPGMGVNALFTYTICQSMGLTWQEGLAVVFVSGILFSIIAFTKLSHIISDAIPSSLKEAITVGIGIFLTFIGLQKGGIVVGSETTFVALGNMTDLHVLATVITLILTVILFARNVPGNFLISMVMGTLIAWMFGLIENQAATSSNFSFTDYLSVFGAMSFDRFFDVVFWTATFSLTMVIVFENIGLVHGHVQMINQPERYKKSLQSTSLSTITCGIFGTSPTVATVETASGITAGGRTGLTAITTGMLFFLSLFFIPFVKLVPDSAIAPILILIGGLMIQNIQNINLKDFTESFPAFLIITLIPLTYSIVDGMAFGFIAYPLIKIAMNRHKEVTLPLYIIALLFLANFIAHSLH